MNDEINEIFKKIFDSAFSPIDTAEILDGCKKAADHKFDKTGICLGCGAHEGMVGHE